MKTKLRSNSRGRNNNTLILKTLSCSYQYPYFIHKKTETEKLNAVSKIKINETEASVPQTSVLSTRSKFLPYHEQVHNDSGDIQVIKKCK